MFFMAFSLHTTMAQDKNVNVSNGTLEVNHKEIPVKIFATTSGVALDQFRQQHIDGNVLIILNDDLNSYASGLYQPYIQEGFQALNKDMQPASMQDVASLSIYLNL